jgi:hypothetical protein
MTTTPFYQGYMKNRCCSSSLLLARHGWTTFGGPRQHASVPIRNVSHSKWSIQKIPRTKFIKRVQITNSTAVLGRKFHSSADYRIKSQGFDWYDVVVACLAALGVSIGFLEIDPFDRHKILSHEESNNVNCPPLQSFGCHVASVMNADVEMTLHQSPTFNGNVPSISSISTDSQPGQLNKHGSSTKPYDVSYLLVDFVTICLDFSVKLNDFLFLDISTCNKRRESNNGR